MTAPVLMVQGTSSDAGKSFLVTALCRLFARRGVRVAPFKAQNMALNARVTCDGREIGTAQAAQAEAAGVEPTTDMNPILLKPMPGLRSQVIVHGRPIGTLGFGEYLEARERMRAAIVESLDRLRASYTLVIAEGAGSPAEINFRDRDLVNTFVARHADARVLLVGDIDRGGVFASLLGTLALLAPEDRARVRGLVINKLRGDASLLAPGIAELAATTERPVLGVLPFLEDHGVPEEDSLALEARLARPRAAYDEIEIAVVALPHLSNQDDFRPLELEPGVVVRYVSAARDLHGADLVVLPGTKATVHDLEWLRDRGFDRSLADFVAAGGLVLGICGGCQMLGLSIEDPEGVEAEPGSHRCLGFLSLATRFAPGKETRRVRGRTAGPWLGWCEGVSFEGYEIHHGRTHLVDGGEPAAIVDGRADGAATERVLGTMVHGILDHDGPRRALLAALRRRRKVEGTSRGAPVPSRDEAYDGIADHVEKHLDVETITAIAGGRR